MTTYQCVTTIRPRRPHWWAAKPDVSIVSQSRTPGKESVLEVIMAWAEQLSPGQTLAFELDYAPALLLRLLERKGFDHWVERTPDGRWRIDLRPLPCAPRR